MEVTPDSNSDYKSGHELMDHIQQLIEEDKFCFLGEKNETLCAKSDSYNLAKINGKTVTVYVFLHDRAINWFST